MEENVQTEAPEPVESEAPPPEADDASEVEVLREKFDETRNLDDAFEMIQAEQDEASLHDASSTPSFEDNAPAVEQAPACDEPTFTASEVQEINLLETEVQQFHQDLAAYEKIKAETDLNAIAKTDKGEASLIRYQLHAAERDLTQRYQQLQQATDEINTRGRNKHFAAEQSKMHQAMPDMDVDALASYLTKDLGFAETEVNSVGDHRVMVLAEKARRYDQLMADQNNVKPKRVPKMRKGVKKPAPVESAELKEARNLAQTRGTPEDAYAYLQATDREKAKSGNQQKQTPRQKVRDAKRKLKKSGREDDALALLRAKKELRAQGAAA